MFNVIEKNQKLVRWILIAVIASFVLWGIGSYLGMSGDDGYVAKVGNQKIYQRDIDNAIAQSKDASPDKMQVLFGLINRQLLLQNFADNHMEATTHQLQQQIANIPDFQESGVFNLSKYQEFLNSQTTSASKFQDNMSKQIVLNETVDFFKSAYFTSTMFNQQFAKLLSRSRNVSSYVVDPKQFYSQITIPGADVSNYYQQNIAKFTIPKRAKFQYIVLSSDKVASAITPTDDQINKYIQSHQSELNDKQVDVSHILFTVPAGASNAVVNETKAKAEKVLSLVRANPAKFATYAKQYSQDPGSANKGGDLGFFARGVMVKQFDNVAFNMKPGQISDLVRTQFGFHLLKLNAIHGGDAASAKAKAIAALQKQQAIVVMQKNLEALNDITYNQPNSLDAAAKKFNLTVQTSDWVDFGAKTGAFALPKIQQALFTSDVIDAHHNSAVVDLGSGNYAVYRVTDYHASIVQKLTEVESQITAQLKLQQASSLAYQQGQKDIAELQTGKLSLVFTNPTDVTLLGQDPVISPMTVKQIFGVSISKLPAYTGGVNDKGAFVIYRINSQAVDSKLNSQNVTVIDQINTMNSSLDLGAYLTNLRSKFSVDYKLDRIQQQQAPAQSQ